jgi:hypothetical protein
MNNLIFIHLGSTPPQHLWDGLERTKRQFPDIRCLLVASCDKVIRLAEIKNIEVYRYSSSELTKEIFSKINQSFDFDFREGFWRFSLERLFAFCDVHEYVGDFPIVHIESDILTFNNFPWCNFLDLRRVSWLKFNDEEDVASIIFSPNLSSTRKFKHHLARVLTKEPHLTDMTVLSKIRRYYPGEYELLPSISPRMALELQLCDSEVLTNFKSFGGYFDPAGLGMWNLGQDPRNGFGFARRFIPLPHATIDPSGVQLSLQENGNLFDQNMDSVFNLHVHSKNTRILKGNSSEYLARYLHSGRYEKRKKVFSFKLFLDLLKDYYKRGKMLELVGNIPQIRRLDRFIFFLKVKSQIKRVRNKFK